MAAWASERSRTTLGALAFMLLGAAWLSGVSKFMTREISTLAHAEGATVASADVAAFWAAARLTLDGNPLAAFDKDALMALQQFSDVPFEAVLPWLHPPGALALLLPLGLLTFVGAWIAINAASTASLAAMFWYWHPRRLALFGMLLFSPATLVCARQGQLAILLTAAAIGAGAALQRDRPFVAGLLLSMLTLKPQLALILLPLCLVSREWRLLAGGAVGVTILHLAPLMIFGLDYFPLWLQAVEQWAAVVFQGDGRVFLKHMVTWYSLFLYVGIATETAMLLHVSIATLMVAATCYIWSCPGTSVTLRMGAMLLAALAMTHYAWAPDGTLALAGMMFLAQSREQDDRLTIVLFCLVWLAPLAAIIQWPLAAIFAPSGLIAVLWAAQQVAMSNRPAVTS